MTALNRMELQKRTKQFGLRVMKLGAALPRSRSANAVANQLLRSATAAGANCPGGLSRSLKRRMDQ